MADVDIQFAAMIVVTNVIMLLVGFLIGDEAHHEAEDIQSETSFSKHVQQALWISRRDTPEGE